MAYRRHWMRLLSAWRLMIMLRLAGVVVLGGAVVAYAQTREDPIAQHLAGFALEVEVMSRVINRLEIDLEERQKRQDNRIAELMERIRRLEADQEKRPATHPKRPTM